jgi:hypothetical protein
MRDALDDSELYLNDDEDGVVFKRRNQDPAPKVIINLKNILNQIKNIFYLDSRSKMGEIRLRSNKRSDLHDALGSHDIKEDHIAAAFFELLLQQLSTQSFFPMKIEQKIRV